MQELKNLELDVLCERLFRTRLQSAVSIRLCSEVHLPMLMEKGCLDRNDVIVLFEYILSIRQRFRQLYIESARLDLASCHYTKVQPLCRLCRLCSASLTRLYGWS